MEIRLLGPVEVIRDGAPVTRLTGRPRTLLAVLALAAPEPVTVDAIGRRVWGADPPENLRPSVQSLVFRLRRLLESEGRHEQALPELRELVAAYPLRESLWLRLLTALSKCGRPAEALTQYEELRRRLADELGTDPDEQLRALHAQLLAATQSRRLAPERSAMTRTSAATWTTAGPRSAP